MPHKWEYTNTADYWQKKAGGRQYRRPVYMARCSICEQQNKYLGHVTKKMTPKEKESQDEIVNNLVVGFCKIICVGDPPLPPPPPEKFLIIKVNGVITVIKNPDYIEVRKIK